MRLVQSQSLTEPWVTAGKHPVLTPGLPGNSYTLTNIISGFLLLSLPSKLLYMHDSPCPKYTSLRKGGMEAQLADPVGASVFKY